MESSDNKQWATKYLLDPLTAPEPSAETGPGTHYRSTFSNMPEGSSAASEDPKKPASSSVRETGYPSPPNSAAPEKSRFSTYTTTTDNTYNTYNQRTSTEIPTSDSGRYRASSISTRYETDRPTSTRYEGNRPLDIIRKETKIAHRAPHLRKKNFVGPDSIDSLDTVGGTYHHDGPFDAVLLARNKSIVNSPVDAVRASNLEALKATPEEKIKDSIRKHRPLDGVATVPPGALGRDGRVYDYEEGANMMLEGDYKRWPGVKYHPDDIKGKGEPSYSIEKAFKDHKLQKRNSQAQGESGIELTSRRRAASGSAGSVLPEANTESYADWEAGVRRSNTTGRKQSVVRKGFGSLRRRRGGDVPA